LLEGIDIACAVCAEVEVVALDEGFGSDVFEEKFINKIGGREAKQAGCVSENDEVIYAAIFQEVNLERKRRENARGFFGVEDSDGVGLEGHHSQRDAFKGGDITGNFYILLMPDMNAVEVADGKDAAIGQLTKLRYGFKDFHNQGLSYLVREKSE
jgi:hypothetical protein